MAATRQRISTIYIKIVVGKYLEIFGRKNNLRNFWVTIGNEVTGTGEPLSPPSFSDLYLLEICMLVNLEIPIEY